MLVSFRTTPVRLSSTYDHQPLWVDRVVGIKLDSEPLVAIYGEEAYGLPERRYNMSSKLGHTVFKFFVEHFGTQNPRPVACHELGKDVLDVDSPDRSFYAFDEAQDPTQRSATELIDEHVYAVHGAHGDMPHVCIALGPDTEDKRGTALGMLGPKILGISDAHALLAAYNGTGFIELDAGVFGGEITPPDRQS